MGFLVTEDGVSSGLVLFGLRVWFDLIGRRTSLKGHCLLIRPVYAVWFQSENRAKPNHTMKPNRPFHGKFSRFFTEILRRRNERFSMLSARHLNYDVRIYSVNEEF